MSKIQVISNTKQKNNSNDCFLSSFLFFLVGLLGFAFCIPSFTYVSYTWQILYPAALIYSLLLWYVFTKHPSRFWMFVSTMVIICGIFILLTWEPMKEQFIYLINSLVGIPLTNEDPEWTREMASINLPLIVVMIVFCIFLFAMEFVFERHETVCILTMVLLLVSPVVGVDIELKAVLLLVLFLVGFWIVHTTGFGKKKSFIGNESKALTTKSSIFGVALTLLFIVCAVPFVSERASELYRSVYFAEQKVNEVIDYFNEPKPPQDQQYVSNLNLDPDGDERLEIYVNEVPEENLYFRTFSGGEYRNSDWRTASDYELFRTLRLNSMGTESLGDWQFTQAQVMTDYLDEMYFRVTDILNENVLDQGQTIVVKKSVKETKIPRPYNSVLLGSADNRNLWGEYDNETYVYQYYPQNSMARTWHFETGTPNYLTPQEQAIVDELDKYKQLQDFYLSEIMTYYSQVPTEQLPKLSQLVRENPLTDLDEITTFIYYTLQSNTEYTRTPNFGASSEDIVERFLFENKKGYCVHYATAATMMFRMYGIPARYASGYVAFTEDFEEQWRTGEEIVITISEDEFSAIGDVADSGSVYTYIEDTDRYKAQLTDESAHAWVEIFIENYGWVPVEMTPLEGDDNWDICPYLDREVMEAILANNGWDMSVPSLSDDSEMPTPRPTVNPSSNPQISDEDKVDVLEIIKEVFVKLLPYITAILFIWLLLFAISYRRKWILRKNRRRACDKTYAVFMDMLHFAGYFLEYNGWEEGFVIKLWEQFTDLSYKDLEKMIWLATEAAYGPAKQEFEKVRFVNRFFMKFAGILYPDLPWYQKLVFKYIKVYIPR